MSAEPVMVETKSKNSNLSKLERSYIFESTYRNALEIYMEILKEAKRWKRGTVKSKLFWAAKLNHTSGLKHLKSLIGQKLIKEMPQEEVVSSSRNTLYAITERGTKALEIYHSLISETTTSCYSDRNIATSMS